MSKIWFSILNLFEINCLDVKPSDMLKILRILFVKSLSVVKFVPSIFALGYRLYFVRKGSPYLAFGMKKSSESVLWTFIDGLTVVSLSTYWSSKSISNW